MTDEERAEEYIRTDGTNGEKVWKKIHKEFPNCIVVQSTKSKKRLSELFFEYTRVVFLDGLAEGRKEKWHDLRKNPNDLPKETGSYLTDDGNTYVYETDSRKWRTSICKACCDFNWLDDWEVIAWCETPKFEE